MGLWFFVLPRFFRVEKRFAIKGVVYYESMREKAKMVLCFMRYYLYIMLG